MGEGGELEPPPKPPQLYGDPSLSTPCQTDQSCYLKLTFNRDDDSQHQLLVLGQDPLALDPKLDISQISHNEWLIQSNHAEDLLRFEADPIPLSEHVYQLAQAKDEASLMLYAEGQLLRAGSGGA
ncbi:MAG: hypothetical protein R2880_10540 [Deinococcales bacterium]